MSQSARSSGMRFDGTNAERYYSSVIKSFADKPTAAVFQGVEVRSLPKQIQAIARRKLMLIETAPSVQSLRVPPGNRLEVSKERGKASGAFESMTSGGSAFAGTKGTHGMSKSAITTELGAEQ